MSNASAAPEISVLLPVFNAGSFLGAALDSLAAQRRVDFEVVAIDDGSTDGSRERLQGAASKLPWLRVVLQEHGGVSRGLNRAFAESRGIFIARMDADDLCAPERLHKQAEFLRANPAVGVCGAWFRVFGAPPTGLVKTPITDAAIRARLIFGSAFAHPAVMARREVLGLGEGPYLPEEDGCEDYGLWLRLARHVRFYNLPEVLLYYRRHPAQVTHSADPARCARVTHLRIRFLEKLGISVNAIEAAAHAATGFEAIRQPPRVAVIEAWLERLTAELPPTGWCDAATLQRECAEAWWRFAARQPGGMRAARHFLCSRFAPRNARTLVRALRLALRR